MHTDKAIPVSAATCELSVMQSTDLEVLGHLLEWLKSKQKVFLCTIVKTWGSSPRPAGSLMACTAKGQLAGSLSGGCVEEELLEQLRLGAVAQTGPTSLTYGLKKEDESRLGLPCGGVLQVVVEPLLEKHIAHFQSLYDGLQQRKCILRTLDIDSGSMQLDTVAHPRALHYDEANPDAPVLKHWYGARCQLFIIGCGMLSMYLAEIAIKMDYKVVVCDPRPQMAKNWPVEGAQVLNAYPDDAIRAHAKDAMTAIVAVTHDPRIDDMGIMEALGTEAFYVGAMGSKRTSKNRRARLKELDITEEQLSRLHAPVGLPIGSKTPPEIAISIMADITRCRAERDASTQKQLS